MVTASVADVASSSDYDRVAVRGACTEHVPTHTFCTGRDHGPGRLDRRGLHAGSMRVLVVEDDLGMTRVLQRGLTEEGYVVDACSDGAEAAWRVRELPYDAMVLDVMLPGHDGFEVCRRLRADNLALPVIMLTARHDVADRVRGLDLGADDYLTKPFSFVELA